MHIMQGDYYMNRKQEREQAFYLIFEKCFSNDSLEEILSLAEDCRDFNSTEYIETVFYGVYENIEVIDEIITKYSTGWAIKRISKVALAILRLAIYEIVFLDDIPNSVSINEAVILAKEYGLTDDASYVNGLLGSYLKNKDE